MRRTLAASVVALGLAVTVTPTVVSAAAGDGRPVAPARWPPTSGRGRTPTAHDRPPRPSQRAQALFSRPGGLLARRRPGRPAEHDARATATRPW